MRIRRRSWKAGLSLIALVLMPVAAQADSLQKLCVPHLAVKAGCQVAYATIQAAIDAADPADTIYIGPGSYAERLVIEGKGVRLVGVSDGSGAMPIIHDAGLPYRDAHIAIVSAQRPELWGLDIQASRAAAAVAVRNTGSAIIKHNALSGSAAVGLHVRAPEAGEEENHGFPVLYNTFTGFETAVKIDDAIMIAVEKSVIAGVGVGIEIARVHVGQLFWNYFEDVAIGVRIRNSNHTDVNSNQFVRAGIGLSVEQYNPLDAPLHRRVPSNDLMEYSHNRFSETATPVSIQRSFPDDGSRSSDPRDDPGGSSQWVDNTVDGIPLPTFKSKSIQYK